MRDDNVVLAKSFDFAVRIVRLYNYLTTAKSERVMSKQLLRCGTSIGANINEAQESISSKEFGAKIYIALKEARETEYWLRLLVASGIITPTEFASINADCEQILKLLTAITKTLRSKSAPSPK
ncbi:MAG: four helix bundle protein [Duncaniella sp.]|nr:four helix bundle protein [Duncaniella sp.]